MSCNFAGWARCRCLPMLRKSPPPGKNGPMPKSPPSATPRSDKAQVILEGALQVFTAQGYAAASMDRIAAKAGVSKSTLYSHFQDKEGLFLALIQSLTTTTRPQIMAMLSQSDLQAPPETVLRQIAQVMLSSFSQNQSALALMRLVIGDAEQFPHVAKAFVREIHKPMLEQLSRYLAAQTQLQLPNPTIAAQIFVGSLMHYLLIQKMLYGDEVLPLAPDTMVDGLIAMMTQTPPA